jgi:hypothetical protein
MWAAIRADLVAYLIDDQKTPPETLRASLAAHIDNVLGSSPDRPGTSSEAAGAPPAPAE